MHITVLAVGKKMPGWVVDASADYARRLPGRWQFSFREFAQAQADNSDVAMAREAAALCKAIPEKSHVIALDNLGEHWTTRQLASQLRDWQALGKNLNFLIGGPDGLHSTCRDRADQIWSLSPLTFPHPLVRVVLVEQLYRAQSLLDNHPYHRA